MDVGGGVPDAPDNLAIIAIIPYTVGGGFHIRPHNKNQKKGQNHEIHQLECQRLACLLEKRV